MLDPYVSFHASRLVACSNQVRAFGEGRGEQGLQDVGAEEDLEADRANAMGKSLEQ